MQNEATNERKGFRDGEREVRRNSCMIIVA